MALDQYFNDDEIVAAYEGRPPYPEKALSALFDSGRLRGAAFREGDAIADIGCGNGRFLNSLFRSKALRRNGISFEKIYAVDPAEKMLGSLRNHFSGFNNLETRQGKFQDLPLEGESVDAIVCASSLHWGTITDEDAFATRKEFMRVLRPNGRLIMLSDSLSQKAGLTRDLYDLQRSNEMAFMDKHGMGQRAWSFMTEDAFMLPLYYDYETTIEGIRAEFASQAFIHQMNTQEKANFDSDLDAILNEENLHEQDKVVLQRGCAVVGGTFKPAKIAA